MPEAATTDAFASMPALWANMLASNALNQQNLTNNDAISHQRVVNGIRENNFAVASKQVHEYDVAEALGYKQATTGNVGAERITDLGSAVAGLQQILKGAQTTIPQTTGGG